MAGPISDQVYSNRLFPCIGSASELLVKNPRQTDRTFTSSSVKNFRKHDIKKSDFATIEYMLRKGQRQLEAYRKPTIQMSTFSL
ncbi:unnamed protein product [Absidia cylindrospora]